MHPKTAKTATAKTATAKNSNSKNSKNNENNENKNSKNKNLRSPSRKDGAPKRQQGAQEGHEGKTNKAKPTVTKDHTPNKCTGCGSTHLTVVKSIIRCITDLKHIVEVLTTKHVVNTCRCDSCGIIVEPETDLPKKGEYSRNIVAEVASQYVDRIPIKRISRNMSRHVKMSVGTTWAIMCRLGLNLGIPAWKIVEIIRNATILHIDETSIRLNGKTIWIWIFFDPMTGATFYAIRPSRGRKVLKEILGDDWKGIVVCDGWKPYAIYEVQRCWAHILREIYYICEWNPDSAAAKRLYDTLGSTYEEACKEYRPEERRAVHDRLLRRVMDAARRYKDDPVLEKFAVKLKNAGADLFRFVLNPEIPSTNNAAERALREIVVHRKIRGGIRAEVTMEWLGNFFTCVHTWQQQNLDWVKKIAAYA